MGIDFRLKRKWIRAVSQKEAPSFFRIKREGGLQKHSKMNIINS